MEDNDYIKKLEEEVETLKFKCICYYIYGIKKEKRHTPPIP